MSSAEINPNEFSYRISANLDQLQALEDWDQYLFYNYKWTVDHPDVPNRVVIHFPMNESGMMEAMAIHHELRKLHLVCFKNWN